MDATETTTGFVLVGGRVEETAAALTRLGKCRVAYTASIGDAASPVFVLAGPHRSNHGQVADYRHDVEAWAERQGCASVIGWWDNDRGWMQSVSLPAGVVVDPRSVAEAVGRRVLTDVEAGEAARHRRLVASMEKWDREAPEREAHAARRAAMIAGFEDQYRPLRDAALAAGAKPADVDYAFGKATQRTGYPGYEQERGVKLLRRMAGLPVEG
jgi:hypothetical protein